jgi:hypothetical protein
MPTPMTSNIAYSPKQLSAESDKPKTDNPKENSEKPKPQGVPKPGVIIRPVGD